MSRVMAMPRAREKVKTPLVDIHAHVYPSELAKKAIAFREQRRLEGESFYDGDTALDGTAEAYDAWLEREGFAFGVVLPLAMKPHQVDKLNDFTEKITKRFPRLLPFGAIHPDLNDIEGVLGDIKARGFLGVKIHPFFQKGATKSPFFELCWLRLFRACAEIGLIVLTCTVFYDDIAERSPRSANDLARLPQEIPGLKLIAAHLGAIYNWGTIFEGLLGSEVYLDLSYALGFLESERILEIIQRHGEDRVLFGTDTPYGSAENNLERFKRLPLSRISRAKIGGMNAYELLRLDRGLE